MLEHTKDKYIFCITPLTLDGMLLRFLFAATVFHTKEHRFIQEKPAKETSAHGQNFYFLSDFSSVNFR